MGGNGYPSQINATCFAACPAPILDPRTKNVPFPNYREAETPSLPKMLATSGRSSVQDARIVVGYSDGSIGLFSMPRPTLLPSRNDSGLKQEGGMVRRSRRINAGGARDGQAGMEAGVTALCSLSAPFGMLVVVGDSDGRLGLWTTSAVPSRGR